MKIVLGVHDVPYKEPQTKPQKRGKPKKTSNISTGDVAEILEEKYGIMKHFFDAHSAEIAHDMEEAVGGALDNVLNGFPPAPNMFGPAVDQIGDRMKTFISSSEAERVGIAGTPTEAALKGVNHRLKHPFAKSNPRRPSFIDTGEYMASLKAWTKD